MHTHVCIPCCESNCSHPPWNQSVYNPGWFTGKKLITYPEFKVVKALFYETASPAELSSVE
jgi:hypothetical protein